MTIESFSITYKDSGAAGKALIADLIIDGRRFGGVAQVECEKIPLSKGFGLALTNLGVSMAKIIEDTLADPDGA